MTADRNVEIGRKVATVRKSRATQQRVADGMRRYGHKWSQATVWQVENGVRPLRFAEAVDLATILDCHLADIEPTRRMTVFEHIVIDPSSDAVRSVCGKVWHPDPDAVALEKCPVCVEVAESMWVR